MGNFFQDNYGALIADVMVLVGTQDYDGVLVPRNALHTVFVQTITISPIAHSDGKTLTFQDSSSTPVPIAVYSDQVVADEVQSPWSVEFGEQGTPLTQGASLNIKGSAAGFVGRIHIEGYQKLTGVGAA